MLGLIIYGVGPCGSVNILLFVCEEAFVVDLPWHALNVCPWECPFSHVCYVCCTLSLNLHPASFECHWARSSRTRSVAFCPLSRHCAVSKARDPFFALQERSLARGFIGLIFPYPFVGTGFSPVPYLQPATNFLWFCRLPS